MPRRILVDRRRDIAAVFFLCAIGSAYFDFRSGQQGIGLALWWNLSSILLASAVGVGLWRASEWARWGGGLIGVYRAGLLAVGFVGGLSTKAPADTASWSVALAVAAVFAVFWAAIAYYLLRPSTRKLFERVRASRQAIRAPA